MSGFNGTRQIINIPANGTLQAIVATGPVRFVSVQESQLTATGAANAPVGFQYKIPNDGSPTGFSQLFEKTPGNVLELGDPQAKTSRWGSVLGNGPDDRIPGGPNSAAATVLFYAQSLTNAATALEVTQYF